MKRIAILGGGTGGTLLANRLRRACRPETAEIIVVDRDGDHVYQPGCCSPRSAGPTCSG